MENGIKLPNSLGLVIWDELNKLGIERRKTKQGLVDMNFTQEEIGLIKKLTIHKPIRNNLQGINLLYNLQNLIIDSDNDGIYQKEGNQYTISDKDMADICKCSSLQNLSINNQVGISSIWTNELKELQSLSIKNNPNLQDIEGLETLENIFSFSCYGNRSLSNIKKLPTFLSNNKELCDLNLDVLLFPNSIGFNSAKRRI